MTHLKICFHFSHPLQWTQTDKTQNQQFFPSYWPHVWSVWMVMKREAKYNLRESSCLKIKVKLQIDSLVILSPVALLPYVSLLDPAGFTLLIVIVRDRASCVHTGLRYLFHWRHMARKITSALGRRRLKTDQLLDWGNWCNWGMWSTQRPSRGQQIHLRTVSFTWLIMGFVPTEYTQTYKHNTFTYTCIHTQAHTQRIHSRLPLSAVNLLWLLVLIICDNSLITPRRSAFLLKQTKPSGIESCLRR
jgi:hypothetical protein